MVQSGETFRTPGCEQILWEDVEDAGGCLSRTRIKTRTRIRIRRSTRIKTRTRIRSRTRINTRTTIRIRSSTRIKTRTRIRIMIRMARHLSGAVCLHETGSSWVLSSTTIVRSSWTLSCSYVDIAAGHPGHPRH